MLRFPIKILIMPYALHTEANAIKITLNSWIQRQQKVGAKGKKIKTEIVQEIARAYTVSKD